MQHPGAAARAQASIAPPEPPSGAERALTAVREAAHAALTAERVEEALHVTLARVAPIVGAAFASAYVADGDSEFLRLGAEYNWPERFRPWLGQMRVKLGSGPSGEAASERRVIEVPDVFADPTLEDWQEIATELGFRALIALPLAAGTRALGAVTFYFSGVGGFGATDRELLRVAADQMALAVARLGLEAQTRSALARATAAESEAERQTVAALEARRSRDEFLANVSHELKTPLTVVLGTIDLLTEELGGPLTAAQHEELSHARDQSERLLALVDTLLALSALRRGVVPVVRDDLDPRVPLRDAAAQVGAPPAGVTFAVDEPATFIPHMRSDREKLARVLAILIDNAFKFTPAGAVRASVAVAAGRVRYRVDDTGIGIPRGAQGVVFEEFRQVDGSATRRYGGAGLGLALARGLARLLGGEIEVVSVDGAGSSFQVSLPLDG